MAIGQMVAGMVETVAAIDKYMAHCAASGEPPHLNFLRLREGLSDSLARYRGERP